MAHSDVHPKHRFEKWQVWPGSYHNPPTDGFLPFSPHHGLKIDSTTPIASMGSCFAREIKKVLVARGFNYIRLETDHPAAVHASAAWERVYSTHCLRQIFEYSLDTFDPDLRWWQAPQSGLVQDPYRRIVLYDSLKEAREGFKRHQELSRQALTSARLLILTLGLTEIWRDQVDGSVICLPAGPYKKEGGDMGRYAFEVSRYEENLANMERIHALMARHNPTCKILVTVSPVHLWATFRKDSDVISASCNSKSTLRAVADTFAAAHDNVIYFPAYEIATIFRPVLGDAYFAAGKENYHVNRETVEFIMTHFFKFFVDQKASPSTE